VIRPPSGCSRPAIERQRHLLSRWADYLERPVEKAAQIEVAGVLPTVGRCRHEARDAIDCADAEEVGERPAGNGGPYSARSRLGGHAPTTQRVGRSLPFSDERHLQAHHWLVEEAYILDAQNYEEWLALLAEDIHYIMPVRSPPRSPPATTPRPAWPLRRIQVPLTGSSRLPLSAFPARFSVAALTLT
jgi:hypothetical protein